MKKHFSTLQLYRLLLLALVFPLLTSCNDDDEETTPSADVTVQFRNLVAGQNITLGQTYTSPSGDTYTVEDFKYYISNVKLLNANGDVVYTEPESYHLINETAGNTAFTLAGVPAGSYSKIAFSMGVDEARNHSTDQEGDLDPSSDMVWDWDTGYKFLLLEGTYTGDADAGGLIFHIGQDENYTTFTMPLESPLTIRTKSGYTLQVSTELNALFQQPNLIDFDEMNAAMGGENARKIVENYTAG